MCIAPLAACALWHGDTQERILTDWKPFTIALRRVVIVIECLSLHSAGVQVVNSPETGRVGRDDDSRALCNDRGPIRRPFLRELCVRCKTEKGNDSFRFIGSEQLALRRGAFFLAGTG